MTTEPQRLGKYELREQLGRGGTAEVWKALDIQLQRYVAIKILLTSLRTDADFVQRFVREAQAIAGLHHPNIVQIHDFHIAASSANDHITYMVMSYIGGGQTLAQYILSTSRMGRFPPPGDLVSLFTSIGQAIDYAHRRGMVHRDIKPANILLDIQNTVRNPMGEPILADFGLVKLLGASGNTLSGVLLGTPHYMSPEQAQGQAGNELSDIYSLGVVLYELCTGVKPFQGDSPIAIIMQRLYTPPTSPELINPHLPPEVAAIILRCLAKEPTARFPNALSIAVALATAFKLTPIIRMSAPPTPLPQSFISSEIGQNEGRDQLSPYGGTPFGVQQPGATARATPLPATPLAPTSLPGSGLSMEVQAVTGKDVARHPAAKRRRKGLFISLAVFLLLVLVGGGLATFLLLNLGKQQTPPANVSVGSAIFDSSGLTSTGNFLGIEDEVKINLDHLTNPAPGKSYYAWLLSDTNQQPMQSLLLEKLPASTSVDFLYPPDHNHTNLLTLYSRFLITEEDAAKTPSTPSTDHSTWRYYSKIPQTFDNTANPGNALGKLRSLLSGIPDQPQLSRMYGGLSTQFLRNVQQVFLLASGAREAKTAPLLRQQLLNILAYIDGSKISLDVSRDQLLGAHLQLSPIPLLDIDQHSSDSYLYRIGQNMQSFLEAPGVTASMISLANQVLGALVSVQPFLEKVEKDAKQLISLNDKMLDDMFMQARYAYSGQTNSSRDNASFINTTIEQLAAFDVQPYKA